MAKATSKTGPKLPSLKGKGEVSAGGAQGDADAAPPRPRVSPWKFFRQVREELGRVTWPSRQEAFTTTIFVFVMVFVAALFFAVVDEVLGIARNFLLSLLG